MNIGIIGLGLIGGSMAKSTKARTLHSVFGIDTNEETMMLARLCGAIDGPLSANDLGKCDLILLAVLPHIAIDWMRENGGNVSKSAVVVDLCGVKRGVFQEMSRIANEHGFTYIGGHPMAGREQGGFVSSSDGLYDASSMILTPGGDADISILEWVGNYFLDLGFARLTFSTPDEHDRIIAYTSQLAHIVSSAYVRSPEAIKRRGFSAGSFRDMTRVARLDADMWTELFFNNRDYLTEQLCILIDNLNEFKSALQSEDRLRVHELLQEGCDIKAKIGEN